jgi:hypothetical protein
MGMAGDTDRDFGLCFGSLIGSVSLKIKKMHCNLEKNSHFSTWPVRVASVCVRVGAGVPVSFFVGWCVGGSPSAWLAG